MEKTNFVLLNKPAVKSIKSEDGDMIYCVDIYKQPAFNHPALKNHISRTTVLGTVVHNYIGAAGEINIWNPYVDSTDDYTTAQIWVKAGPNDNFESVEGGWAVNPELYGDELTRLFIYWTDPSSGNWWLKIDYDKVIGYWPGSLFTYLGHSATLVEWGGQVYSPNVKKHPQHTKNAMGSGSFSQTLEGSACFINQARIIDSSLQLKYPSSVGTAADENECYDVFNLVGGQNAEPLFYFGCPGQIPNCN